MCVGGLLLRVLICVVCVVCVVCVCVRGLCVFLWFVCGVFVSLWLGVCEFESVCIVCVCGCVLSMCAV